MNNIKIYIHVVKNSTGEHLAKATALSFDRAEEELAAIERYLEKQEKEKVLRDETIEI